MDAHFHLTGYIAPAGDNTWIGQRNASTVSKFQFLETRGIFEEFPTSPAPIGGATDQYYKENEPYSVMPLVGFSFQPTGLATADITWQSGGRNYAIHNAFAACLSPGVCSGTWSDGSVARRVPEGFAPVIQCGSPDGSGMPPMSALPAPQATWRRRWPIPPTLASRFPPMCPQAKKLQTRRLAHETARYPGRVGKRESGYGLPLRRSVATSLT